MILSAEQSAALAMRPYAKTSEFRYCSFKDNGTAFVDALENRQSSFGSLIFEEETCNLSVQNLKRLFQVDVIEHLELPLWKNADDIGLFPLTAKVDSLSCFVGTESLKADLSELNILASKLSIAIHKGVNDVISAEATLSFLQRLANFGHFKELDLEFDFVPGEVRRPCCMVKELIRVVLANENLESLGLFSDDIYWETHFEELFQGIQKHNALRTLQLNPYEKNNAFGPGFSYLRQLLCHNRYLTVTDSQGKIFTDGAVIDAIYSLNCFYRGSVSLLAEPLLERSSLVACALMERGFKNLQRTGLLLADHTDVLCEFLHLGQLDDNESLPLAFDRGQKRRRQV
jgi:hypothetical protein